MKSIYPGIGYWSYLTIILLHDFNLPCKTSLFHCFPQKCLGNLGRQDHQGASHMTQLHIKAAEKHKLLCTQMQGMNLPQMASFEGLFCVCLYGVLLLTIGGTKERASLVFALQAPFGNYQDFSVSSSLGSLMRCHPT